MGGKRGKPKIEHHQCRNNLVQRFMQATGACFGRRRNRTSSPWDGEVEGAGRGPHVHTERLQAWTKQTTFLYETQDSIDSSKLYKQTSSGVRKMSTTPNVPTNRITEVAEMKIMMKQIFPECKHMSWLIPYMCNWDDNGEELQNNNPNVIEGSNADITVDMLAVSKYVAGIIQVAQNISATELQNTCAEFLEGITQDAVNQVENNVNNAHHTKSQRKFGEKATESVRQTMPNPCIQPACKQTGDSENTSTGAKLKKLTQHEIDHDKESNCPNQETVGPRKEEEDTASESERLWNLMATFDVQYTCRMDDFCVDLLEMRTLVNGGTFGKTYKAKYAEASVEVTLYSEGYPAIDPGRLLCLQSKFAPRVLVYLQDENDTDCIIYPDNYLGTLDDLMEADPDRFYLGEDQAIFILSGLLEGIKHMRSRRIVHGHLTPDVVKLNEKGYPIICDFSHAYKYRHGKMTTPRAEEFHVWYVSPEVASNAQIVPESDVFAAGSIAYEIVDGLPPFTGEDSRQTLKNILDNEYRVEFDPDIFSEKAATIISICLRPDIQARTEWEEMYDFLLEPDIDTDQEKESLILPVVKKLLDYT